ncbi:threonine ammonia-lyase [Methanoculleus sp. FWC-SCC1]|uniref:threonine ammonia-lyase n=1 Tax=Methanoculleus frigidifontis TaxID=2584085 RepID=A0ABT8MBG0_9EURY|nr:threonine ammonia-lyase [Methanoculleus sp. FWC-SCC1]MDN7025259.1 threonine ammonia-lyase [Methanoculleus sp. FWC-SCC1]
MVSPELVRQAAARLHGRVIHTPLTYSPSFSRMTGAEVFLKLENLQKTGSFKVRGAANAILAQSAEIGPGGVVTASAGNHAQGVALAAREAGIPATIVMPRDASLSKQEATRGYGATLLLQGETLAESLLIAGEMAEEKDLFFIHPYDDPHVIAGQGTVGLEVLEDCPNPDIIFVPVGGGGLAAGLAVAVRDQRPDLRIVGVQAAACPSACEACRAGARVSIDPGHSIADGITVRQVGAATFPTIRDLVDEIVLVTEDQIAAAIVLLLERKKILAEGAGAVTLAALLSGAVRAPAGSRVVLVVSGGNLDPLILDRVLRRQFLAMGRIMRFSVCLPDEPGALVALLSLLRDIRANILAIDHVRHGPGIPLFSSRVDIEMETRGHEHIAAIRADLAGAGYAIRVR